MVPLDDRTARSLQVRLWVMMFLQYFVQGSYLPVASVYAQDALKFDAWQIGVFKGALALGPLAAPFLLGQLVDRYFSNERVLAACHFLAGLLMFWLYVAQRFWVVIFVAAFYSLLYVPTMMLTNSLAFHHLRHREREFPRVRLWGTIGFIVPAWLIELVFLPQFPQEQLATARAICFLVAGIAELVLAGYCLTLPYTPPQRDAAARYAPGRAAVLLGRRDFLVLVGASLIVALLHSYFFLWNSPFLRWFLDTGGYKQAAEQRLSSLGQIAEILVMFVLGWTLARLGFQRVLLLGTAAYGLRALIFALVPYYPFGTAPYSLAVAIVCVGEALHGVCFACFLAAAYIYVDRCSPPDVRASMQTLYGTLIVGLGTFLGGLAGGVVGGWFRTTTGEPVHYNWTGIWLASAALTLVPLAMLAVWFRPHEEEPPASA